MYARGVVGGFRTLGVVVGGFRTLGGVVGRFRMLKNCCSRLAIVGRISHNNLHFSVFFSEGKGQEIAYTVYASEYIDNYERPLN